MILLNANCIYDLGRNLYCLSSLRGEKQKSEVHKIFVDTISLLNRIKILDLHSVYENVNDFIALLKKSLQSNEIIISQDIIYIISTHALRLDLLLFNNLHSQVIYTPTPKGAYRTEALLFLPEKVFPLGLIAKVPEVVYDVKQCTKALAFDLHTASALHALRIFEKVLIRYAESQDMQLEQKKRSIGDIIGAIEKKDNPILPILKMIKNYYRNPLIHSEINMTAEEVRIFLGVINGAISFLIKDLPILAEDLEKKDL